MISAENLRWNSGIEAACMAKSCSPDVRNLVPGRLVAVDTVIGVKGI
jgi:hypothetical protein